MSNLEFLCFCGYLLIQFLIPLRRYFVAWVLRQRDVVDTRDMNYFSWTMRLSSVQACESTFRVFDLEGDDTLLIADSSEFLTDNQAGYLVRNPNSVLVVARQIEKKLRKKGLKNFGIQALVAGSVGEREVRPIVDHKTDLVKEAFHCITPYPWII